MSASQQLLYAFVYMLLAEPSFLLDAQMKGSKRGAVKPPHPTQNTVESEEDHMRVMKMFEKT